MPLPPLTTTHCRAPLRTTPGLIGEGPGLSRAAKVRHGQGFQPLRATGDSLFTDI